jgi:hypothetical protein
MVFICTSGILYVVTGIDKDACLLSSYMVADTRRNEGSCWILCQRKAYGYRCIPLEIQVKITFSSLSR